MRFGVRVWTLNLGSLSGKGLEVCEELRKLMIDVSCLPDVRWREQGARILGMNGRYKLWWSGRGDGVGGVGVMVKGELCEEMVDVGRVGDGVVTVVVFEMDVLRLICGHFLQIGRSLEEKQCFYDKLKCELDMHSAGDLIMCLGDFNGHVDRHIDVFDGVHGGFGVGQRNFGVKMLLEFCLEKELCVSNTWLKREEKRKVTFRMGENEKTIECADKERSRTVHTKCNGDPLGVSTCISDNGYR